MRITVIIANYFTICVCVWNTELNFLCKVVVINSLLHIRKMDDITKKRHRWEKNKFRDSSQRVNLSQCRLNTIANYFAWNIYHILYEGSTATRSDYCQSPFNQPIFCRARNSLQNPIKLRLHVNYHYLVLTQCCIQNF